MVQEVPEKYRERLSLCQVSSFAAMHLTRVEPFLNTAKSEFSLAR